MKQFELRQRLAKAVRTKRGGMGLRAFAKKYDLVFSSVARIEREEQNVTITALEKLCTSFGCDIVDLFPPLEYGSGSFNNKQNYF